MRIHVATSFPCLFAAGWSLALGCGGTRDGSGTASAGTGAGSGTAGTASTGQSDEGEGDGSGEAGTSTGATSASTGSESGTGGSSSTTGGTGATTTSSSDTGGPRLDVGPGGDGTSAADDSAGMCDPMVDEDCGCTAVDILVVVDNSVSMGDYQNALGLAFPQFADAMIGALPPGTSLRVGVTSTEMGYASGGSTMNCTSTGDGKPMDQLYVTPDVMNTGKNGAQGRLFVPSGHPAFFEVATDAAPGDIAALKTWFSAAVAIGEGGSNVEMSTAAAGWVADPLNNGAGGPNMQFIRNEGAVLVVFFLQDEPDQTPLMIDGKTGGRAMLDKIAAAKSACGGLDCVLGGGFVNQYCLGMLPGGPFPTPIGEFLAGMSEPAAVAELPDENTAEDMPQVAADEMSALMGTTLAGVIAQKCQEIPPPVG